MSLAELACFITAEPDFDTRWRLVVEFLTEYHQEPEGTRRRLLADVPEPTGDERWDVLFAGLAEHLATRDGKDAPGWAACRGLRRFWFPFDTPGARAQALVHAPAALRRRGVVADLYVFGGAAMALAYDSRRATRDIDALFKPHGIVLEEAQAVAAELGLPRWWLNEQASSYVVPGGDSAASRVSALVRRLRAVPVACWSSSRLASST